MSRVLRVAALFALAFAALALGGCGGGDEDRKAKNAYVREVNAAQSAFALTVDTVAERIARKRSSSSQSRKTLEQFQSAIEDVVKDLRAIEVPGSVQSEHDQLVSVMSGFGAQIKKANAALRNPTSRNIGEARNTIATATQTVNVRIDSAIAAINSELGQK